MSMGRTLDEDRLAEFMARIVADLGGASTVATVCLGDQLGLYAAMAGAGWVTAAELAAATGCHRRLVQEWLDQQAAAGYVRADVADRTYHLPDEHAAALAYRDSAVFVAGGQHAFAAMFRDLDLVADAFRGDGGLAWGEHHASLFSGTAEFFRPIYQQHLTSDWIPSLDGVDAALRAGGRVADVGCGHGYSTLAVAAGYPDAEVVGFDSHEGSVEAARANARALGADERVRFEVAASDAFEGVYELIVFGDCLHDMGNPVAVAAHAGTRLAQDGRVMVIEPFAANDHAANLDLPTAKVFYGASTFLCTPSALSQDGGHALGAQAGEPGTRAVFDDAGYTGFRRVAETPFNLVYEATGAVR